MFSKANIAIFLLALLGVQNSVLCSHKNKLLSIAYAITLFAVGSASVITYNYGPLIYEVILNKINERIEMEIADDLVLLFTPNGTINNLPEAERAKKFIKKARLVNGRIRILEKLETILEAEHNGLSKEHKESLKNTLNKAHLFFGPVDMLRSVRILFKENPYENDYKVPTMIDQFIENRIVNAIIASARPESEGDESEKLERNEARLSMGRIVSRITKDIGDVAWQQFKRLVPVW